MPECRVVPASSGSSESKREIVGSVLVSRVFEQKGELQSETCVKESWTSMKSPLQA